VNTKQCDKSRQHCSGLSECNGLPPTSIFQCQLCKRICRSWIETLAHRKSHSWWEASR